MEKEEKNTMVLLLLGIACLSVGTAIWLSWIEGGRMFYMSGFFLITVALLMISKRIGIMLLGLPVGVGVTYLGMLLDRTFKTADYQWLIVAGAGIVGGSIFTLLYFSLRGTKSPSKMKLQLPEKQGLAFLLMIACLLPLIMPVTQATSQIPLVKVVEVSDIKIRVEEQESHLNLVVQKNDTKIVDIVIEDKKVTVLCNETVDSPATILQDTTSSIISDYPETLTFNKTFELTEFTALAKYWWDNVYFVGSGQYIKYPHPDRDYYGISPYSTWIKEGTKLWHYQIDRDTSAGLASLGPGALGGAIGALVGALIGGPHGAVVGAIVGAVFTSILTLIANWILLDEQGCIWWWTSRAFIQWLRDNALALAVLYSLSPSLAIAWAAGTFTSCGYLRVGSLTFADYIGAGNPGPPPPPPPPTFKPRGGGGGGKYGPFLL
jgi:hypothetical protein